MTDKKKAESTALAVMKSTDLLPENVEFDGLIENLKEMDEVDFPRLRCKKGKFFFTDDPEDKGVEEFEGVILAYANQNTYWEGTFDPKNITPPDCYSLDAKAGSKPRNEDGQFGNCTDCKFNQFGSGQGKGKACRNQVVLYVQAMKSVVPTKLFVAPTSLQAFKTTFLINKVTQKGLSYPNVVAKIKIYTKGDETYSRLSFEVAGTFQGEEAARVKKLREFWMEAIKRDRNRLDISSVGGGDDDSNSSKAAAAKAGSKPNSSAKPEAKTNTRTVTPRQPTPVKAEVAEGGSSNMSDDEEPPF